VKTLAKNFSGIYPEAGCDEAGRGCLAGPVFAAAVILNPEKPIAKLNDSKQLSEKDRYLIRDLIVENALSWGVAQVSEKEIDRINILNASILGMHRALEQLSVQPSFIIVDGNKFKPFKSIPHQTIVKGDAKFQAISAASILAKTFRDDYMLHIHNAYPFYHWAQNKGYPTISHRQAIFEHGASPHHRLTFRLLKEDHQYSLFP
jgi:ribonuclease HII